MICPDSVSTFVKLNEWLANHESQEGEVHLKEKRPDGWSGNFYPYLRNLLLPRHGTCGYLLSWQVILVSMISLERHSAWLRRCLFTQSGKYIEIVRGKVRRLCLWSEFYGPTENSYPSSLSGDRRPVNLWEPTFAVDEKSRGRGQLLYPTTVEEADATPL